jgi:serine carboxypeptidase-like clade 2
MWTWTQAANVIFIEQPAGVGFSYSETPSDYTVGDYQASQDVLQFMLGFLERYPQYATRSFYLSGESYGGHYVPSFANAIVRSNLAGVNPKINIQGFIAGNAWTVAELDNIGAITYWYTRTMIDNATYNGILSTCNMSDVGPLLAKQTRDESDWEVSQGIKAPPRPLGFTPLLDSITGKAKVSSDLDCDGWTNQGFNLLSGIDIYDSFSDVCTVSSSSSSVSSSLRTGSNNNAGCAIDYDPCRDGKTTTYLNDPQVKSLIHANASIVWTGCSDIVDYSRFDLLSSMLPTYQFLISQGLRISVYSGDVDAIVPTVGTREWINALGVNEVVPIRAWTVNGQVGGWTTQYKELNFTTIRNAGHFVPEMQGERALKFFKSFLNNEPL